MVMALLALLEGIQTQGAIQFTGYYAENFNTLESSGTPAWNNDVTLGGWSLFDKNSTALATYTAGTGSGNSGSFYSFGSLSSGERALGGLGSGGAYFGSPSSGSVAGYIAVAIQNKSGSTYTGFVLQFAGEQWRDGGNTAAQTMQMQYGFGATFAGVTTWIAPGGSFDYASPVHTATAAAVDGNNVGKVSGLGGTISGISWVADQTLWLRWHEINDVGDDHGLAIDDLSVTGVPEPVNVALGFFCGIAVGVLGVRQFQSRRKQARTAD